VSDLGLDELSTPSTVVAIEWADRLPRRLRPSVSVSIEDRGGDVREIRIETLA
jgi:tRNA A37 threonylcarbamoyladenosine biosynthesis protein TsaE